MNYLLDTNICIYLIKKKPESVFNRLKEITLNKIFISSITLAELQFGVRKSLYPEKNKIALEEFIKVFNVSSFDSEAAIEYGIIRSYLEKKGTPIGSLDTLIAAHAKSLGMTLVTNNVNEFKRVEGLLLENWTE
jgi:tRNA(fMet)-specific endonuclease VapC